MTSATAHDDPDTQGPKTQIDEIQLSDLGKHFVELGEKLQAVGRLTESQTMPVLDGKTVYARNVHEDMTMEEVIEWEADVRKRVRQTLTGLREFRRGYERWQRLTAEYALTQLGYTQRDTAELLGVAASTINRWAQHPLPIEDYS